MLKNKRILIIGDAILDEYVYGTATRLSPEAPVPIVAYESSEYRLGGAANVAANIKALGGEPTLLALANGDDREGMILRTQLIDSGIAYSSCLHSTRKTTHKTRIIANKQQIARLDKEDIGTLSGQHESALAENIDYYRRNYVFDAVVISDYAKGVITEKVLCAVRKFSVPVFLDPKVKHARLYQGLQYHAMTPNLHEAEGLSGMHIHDDISLASAAKRLLSLYSCLYVLITRGEDGMALCAGGNSTPINIPTMAQSVFDVSGAGDTVIATLALAYASGMSMTASAELANKAAGIVVGKQGTAVVTKEELENSWVI